MMKIMNRSLFRQAIFGQLRRHCSTSTTSTSTQNGAPAAAAETSSNESRAIEDLSAEYAKLLDEHEIIKDKYKRALAETENVRRRGQRQIDETKLFAIQSFCKDLLEVADNLNAAVASVNAEELKSNDALRKLHSGIVMTNKILCKTFERHGLVAIDPIGAKFDPNLHAALFEVDANETYSQPGIVAHVAKIGYSLRDRPIRPAQVGVVRGGK